MWYLLLFLAIYIFALRQAARYATRRGWFAQLAKGRVRFGLQALFAAVTILGVLFGWFAVQAKWIRDRRQALSYLTTKPGRDHYYGSGGTTAPWPIRMLGAEGVNVIAVSDRFAPSERERLHSLFPEAELKENHQGPFE